MSSKFPWGRVLDRFEFDFDGAKMEAIKYHPWVLNEHPRRAIETETLYSCEEIRQSDTSLQRLVVSWLAYKSLGLNQHALVSGVCRALEL